jgi:hypothetical protein
VKSGAEAADRWIIVEQELKLLFITAIFLQNPRNKCQRRRYEDNCPLRRDAMIYGRCLSTFGGTYCFHLQDNS